MIILHVELFITKNIISVNSHAAHESKFII